MRESGYKKKQKLQKEGDNKKNQMLLHKKQKDWLKNKQKLNCNGKLRLNCN